jgi:hypothetical protein
VAEEKDLNEYERGRAMKKITQLRGKLLLTAGYFAVLLILRRLDVQCIFLSWFHIPCPGCGMSRAFAAALRFDFLEAFAYHPMFWSMPILYLYYLIDGGVFRSKKINRAILVSIAVGFAVQWVMKIVNYC